MLNVKCDKSVPSVGLLKLFSNFCLMISIGRLTLFRTIAQAAFKAKAIRAIQSPSIFLAIATAFTITCFFILISPFLNVRYRISYLYIIYHGAIAHVKGFYKLFYIFLLIRTTIITYTLIIRLFLSFIVTPKYYFQSCTSLFITA